MAAKKKAKKATKKKIQARKRKVLASGSRGLAGITHGRGDGGRIKRK
jgi:hypothetical protein